MLIGSGLEAVGLGLIIPLVSLILETNNQLINFFPDFINDYLFSLDLKSRVFYFSILIGLFYFIKNIFIGFLYYKINMFAFTTRSNLGSRLFNIYLKKPYPFFTNQNSSILINNIHNESNTFCESALLPILIIITETLLISSICIILLFFDPVVTLIVFVSILLFSFIFQYFSKPLNLKWGLQRQSSDESRLKILTQGFDGIRELKIFDKLSFFKKKFYEQNHILGKSSGYQTTLQNFPKLYLELIAIISFLMLIFYNIFFRYDTDNLIVLLSLFGIAAFRMLPSANKLIHAQQSLRFSSPSIKRLNDEINNKSNNFSTEYESIKLDNLKTWNSIKLNNVSFQHNKNEEKIFKNISFEINRKDKIGLLGETGIGKSTLFDLLCGLINPTEGKILIDEKDILIYEKNSYLNKFGYVSQNIFLFDDTIQNNICFELENQKNTENKHLSKIIKICELENFINRLENKLGTFVGQKGLNYLEDKNKE